MSLNFSISKDHTENNIWRALNFPDMSYLKHVTVVSRTNSVCNDSQYDIVQCLIYLGIYFRNPLSNIENHFQNPF